MYFLFWSSAINISISLSKFAKLVTISLKFTKSIQTMFFNIRKIFILTSHTFQIITVHAKPICVWSIFLTINDSSLFILNSTHFYWSFVSTLIVSKSQTTIKDSFKDLFWNEYFNILSATFSNSVASLFNIVLNFWGISNWLWSLHYFWCCSSFSSVWKLTEEFKQNLSPPCLDKNFANKVFGLLLLYNDICYYL